MTPRLHVAIVATAPDRLSCYGFAAVRQTTIGSAWLAQLDAAKNATNAPNQGEAA